MSRHTGRGRSALVDAGYRCIAERGYAGATTAWICERAGVSSGTFFHFFPTKIDLVIAILSADAARAGQDAETLFAVADADAVRAMDAWIDRIVDEAADTHFVGFVAAIGSLASEQRIRAILHDVAQRGRRTIAGIVHRGQVNGAFASTRPPDVVADWVDLAAGGYLARVAEDPDFSAAQGAPHLREMVARLLA